MIGNPIPQVQWDRVGTDLIPKTAGDSVKLELGVNATTYSNTGVAHVKGADTERITFSEGIFFDASSGREIVFNFDEEDVDFVIWNDASEEAYRYDNGLKTHSYLGQVAITDTTASTSSSTGALTVAGGVGIGGDLILDSGSNPFSDNGLVLFESGGTNFTGLYGNQTNAIIKVANGGRYTFSSNLFTSNEPITIADATASTSPTNGALTVTGGAGIGGELSVNGRIYVFDPIGTDNLGIGQDVLSALTSGASSNVGVGTDTLRAVTTGDNNLGFGTGALRSVTGGSNNVGMGRFSMNAMTSGSSNVGVGSGTGQNGTALFRNTWIGFEAGKNNNHNDCVLIGYQAGLNNSRDHTLYIENSSSTTPLIYGEFDNDFLRFNGSVNISDTTDSTSTTTGALTVDGGIGVGGSVVIDSGTNVFSSEGFIVAASGGVPFSGVYGDTSQVIIKSANNARYFFESARFRTIERIETEDTTVSTSNTTGAVVVAGGIGVAGLSTFGPGTAYTWAETAHFTENVVFETAGSGEVSAIFKNGSQASGVPLCVSGHSEGIVFGTLNTSNGDLDMGLISYQCRGNGDNSIDIGPGATRTNPWSRSWGQDAGTAIGLDTDEDAALVNDTILKVVQDGTATATHTGLIFSACSWNGATLDEFFNITNDGFVQYGTQTVTGTDTVTRSVVFCTGSGYTLTMPASPVKGQHVEVFNRASSGFITISQIDGSDFTLYAGESLDCKYDGASWAA